MSTEHHRRLARMYLDAPVNQLYGPEIDIGPGTATIRQAAEERFFHAAHALHGSVLFKVMDDAAFFAANSLVEDRFVLTVAFDLHFLAPVTGGTVTARAEVVHEGQRLLVADARVHDEDDRLVARGTGSFVRSRVELSEELGYR